jgi:acyl-CoA synthetase (AMP-forming)/AMP-acid ligase II
MLLSDMLRHSTRIRPGHIAVADDARAFTYAETSDRALRLANALRGKFGLASGDRFAVVTTNRAEVVEIYFAAAIARLICVPLNPRLAAPELAGAIANAGARLVIAERALEEKLEAVSGAGYDGALVWLAGPGAERGDYEDVLHESSAAARVDQGSPSDPVLLMYTSGSTGLPKGVLLTQGNLSANSWHLLAEDSVTRHDRYLNSAPLSNLGAGSRVFMLVHAGGTHVIRRAFDAEQMLAETIAGTVNAALIVPAMMRHLLDAADAAGEAVRGRLRQVTYGTAPMPPDLLIEALERLGSDFQQGYGLTEAGHNLTLLPPEDHRLGPDGTFSQRLASVGRETIGMHVRVVDENGDDVPVGQAGEVITRGPNVMEGYWEQPEETANALRDGWLHTGDIGSFDDDGYLYLVDRKKDMLVSGGFNVFPREIERHLEMHPQVLDVAVVGGPHERWGEVPIAFVVLVKESDPAGLESELRGICEHELARYKQPAQYRFVPELPRTSTGKVAKPELRRLLAGVTPQVQEVSR